MRPCTWLLVIALAGTGFLFRQGWAARTAGTTVRRRSIGTSSPTTPLPGRREVPRASRRGSSSPSSRNGTSPHKQLTTARPNPGLDFVGVSISSGRARTTIDGFDGGANDTAPQLGKGEQVYSESMGRVWRAIGDDDDDDEEEEAHKGIFGRMADYVRSYAMSEGLGMLDDNDISCLVQVYKAHRVAGKKDYSFAQPLVELTQLAYRTSPWCKLRLLAKGRMFARPGFLRGLFQAVMDSKSKTENT